MGRRWAPETPSYEQLADGQLKKHRLESWAKTVLGAEKLAQSKYLICKMHRIQ